MNYYKTSDSILPYSIGLVDTIQEPPSGVSKMLALVLLLGITAWWFKGGKKSRKRR